MAAWCTPRRCRNATPAGQRVRSNRDGCAEQSARPCSVPCRPRRGLHGHAQSAAPLTVYLVVGSFTAIYNNAASRAKHPINTVRPFCGAWQRHGAGDDHEQHATVSFVDGCLFAACRARSTSADFIEPLAAPPPPLSGRHGAMALTDSTGDTIPFSKSVGPERQR